MQAGTILSEPQPKKRGTDREQNRRRLSINPTTEELLDILVNDPTTVIDYIKYSFAYGRNGYRYQLVVNEDIFQDVYIYLLENHHRYDSTRSKLSTWIYNNAKYIIQKQIQRRKDESEVYRDYLIHKTMRTKPDKKQRILDLEDKCLSDKERDVAWLVGRGFTFREIGQMLGISTTYTHKLFINVKEKYLLGEWKLANETR